MSGALSQAQTASTGSLPARWRFWRAPAERAAVNMAWDDVLLDTVARDGSAIFRCYGWLRPAISFGRHEAIRERFSPDTIRGAGLDAVRRPTGGRALLHVEEVTYAVAMPIDAGRSWRSAYDAINNVLVAGLRTLGIDARLARGTGGMSPSSALCFAAPSAGEIVVGDAKLVGSAVWRTRHAFLQQGSIILDGDQSLLRSLAAGAPSELAPVATVRSMNPALQFNDVAAALRDALGAVGRVHDWQPDDKLQRAVGSRVNHYMDPEWLWRH